MVKKLLTLAVLSTLPYVACAQGSADSAASNPAPPRTSERQAATPGSGASGANALNTPAPSEQAAAPLAPNAVEPNGNNANDEANNANNEPGNAANETGNAGDNAENDVSSAAGEGRRGRPLESMRESVLMRGTVRAIDRDDRLLAMEVPGGQLAIIHVGDNVKNFDRLKVDEPATVRYTEAVALSIGKANGAQENGTQEQGAQASNDHPQPSSGVAKPGAEPKTLIGKLTDIDRADGMITVTTSDGRRIQLRAPDESALSGVAKGDSVYVSYREAAAVSVAPGTTAQEDQAG
ncbi:MAG TPA: hypothetical protein VL742_06375 [Casimicrobiaceae bacterium]|nr:hypothetical protein [Casimicrobiaceae bacterium]